MLSSGEAKNILIISQNFFPNSEKDYKIKEKIEEYANQGINVSVIARKGASDTAPEIPNTKFYFIEQEKFSGGGEWAYVFHNISFMVKAMRIGSAIKEKFDMVIATIPSGLTAIAAKIIAGKNEKGFYIDINENWVESALASNYIVNGGAIYKASIMVENWVLKNGKKI